MDNAPCIGQMLKTRLKFADWTNIQTEEICPNIPRDIKENNRRDKKTTTATTKTQIKQTDTED